MQSSRWLWRGCDAVCAVNRCSASVDDGVYPLSHELHARHFAGNDLPQDTFLELVLKNQVPFSIQSSPRALAVQCVITACPSLEDDELWTVSSPWAKLGAVV